MADTFFSQAEFKGYLAEHKLMGSRCVECGKTYLPPRALCTACYGEQMEWVELEGEGVIKAFTTIHIAPTAMIEAGYGRDKPYCSGIVELSDGLAVSAQILGVDVEQPGSIAIGTPVKVEFIDRGEGEAQTTFLAFRVTE